ncbi:hypothetical protein E2562_034719 [Oryza meyeriana var. granulata]|uniref:Secreted protein n=1 Tax=Oryza meyeriana var. granulata TaxID=110450 RepID=A0A6G1CAR6_9ORYZ|nr:hypothetical protein E2562_034719 [Oryza meyeriana var. granulata]
MAIPAGRWVLLAQFLLAVHPTAMAGSRHPSHRRGGNEETDLGGSRSSRPPCDALGIVALGLVVAGTGLAEDEVAGAELAEDVAVGSDGGVELEVGVIAIDVVLGANHLPEHGTDLQVPGWSTTTSLGVVAITRQLGGGEIERD